MAKHPSPFKVSIPFHSTFRWHHSLYGNPNPLIHLSCIIMPRKKKKKMSILYMEAQSTQRRMGRRIKKNIFSGNPQKKKKKRNDDIPVMSAGAKKADPTAESRQMDVYYIPAGIRHHRARSHIVVVVVQLLTNRLYVLLLSPPPLCCMRRNQNRWSNGPFLLAIYQSCSLLAGENFGHWNILWLAGTPVS